MKQFNKILALAISACLLETTTSFAAANTSNSSESNLASAIQKITEQQAELQREITMLRGELAQVKKEKAQAQQQLVASKRSYKPGASATKSSNTMPVQRVTSSKEEAEDKGIENLIGRPVITSPYLNMTSAYDASDLIVYQSPINEDLFFLKQRRALMKELGAENLLPSFSRPIVTLSGKVETQAVFISPHDAQDQSNFDLSGAELDVLAEVSPWALGYLSIQYNNAPLDQNLTGSGNPISNSQLFVNRGFITIGNLDKSPLYLTMGQMYVPFGSYSSYMVSNPVTKSLGRINTRALEFGFAKSGVYASIYGFNGASTVDNSTIIDNFGSNLGYKFSGFGKKNNISGDFAVGIINNTTDAQGVQNTGGSSFQGFSQSSATESLVRQVPGIDLRGYLSNDKIYGLAEAVLTTRAYSPLDMTFNNVGAHPMAGHVEAGYIFEAWKKPTAFSLAYDVTSEALAIGLPRESFTAVINTSIWKNTIEALEFRHDINYAATDFASGQCQTTDSAGNTMITVCPVTSTGGSQNSVIAQLGIYF